MNEEIKNLLDLQEIDQEIRKLETEAKETQSGLELKKKEYGELMKVIEEQRTKIQQYEVKTHDMEVEQETFKERLAKYQEQRNFIKKPRELFAIDKEIETTLKAMRVNENELKKIATEFVNFKTNAEQDQAKATAKEEEIAGIEASLKEKVDQNNASITGMKDKRKTVVEKVGTENMETYAFITRKQGVALAEVIGEACGQCFISLPPQLINEIKKGDRLIRCTSCARILYLK